MAKETRKAGKKSRQAAGNAPPESNGEAFVVRALAKGLAMLNLFDAEHRDWTLDEMVTELKLPRMTGYRMARTLQSAGYLVSDPQSGRYRSGRPSSRRRSLGGVRRAGGHRPALPRLARRGHRRVGDAGGRCRRSRRVRGHGRLAAPAQAPGGRGPHHRRHGQRARQDVCGLHVRRRSGAPAGDTTRAAHAQDHHRPQELAAELRRVRDEGVAFDIEERNLGTCAVAAPVKDQMGSVIGSIGVIVPTAGPGLRRATPAWTPSRPRPRRSPASWGTPAQTSGPSD